MGIPGDLRRNARPEKGRLKIHLAKFGYSPVAQTPSVCKHSTKDICLSLVVDDFGVKHVGKDMADHLIQAFNKLYTISIDWTGSLCFGLTINWAIWNNNAATYI